nr:putative pre-16S rRNA nuclease [Nerophis lumbriciformis]
MPLTAIERTTDRRAIYQLVELANSRGVEVLVLGEPRLLDGQPSPNMARIRRFGERLSKVSGLPIAWVEETLTTVEADELLRQAELRLHSQRQRRDSLAAQVLLQEFLDQSEPAATGIE